jgi:hypothetical protein
MAAVCGSTVAAMAAAVGGGGGAGFCSCRVVGTAAKQVGDDMTTSSAACDAGVGGAAGGVGVVGAGAGVGVLTVRGAPGGEKRCGDRTGAAPEAAAAAAAATTAGGGDGDGDGDDGKTAGDCRSEGANGLCGL